jgi:mono/diheme cytochrome c family protein
LRTPSFARCSLSVALLLTAAVMAAQTPAPTPGDPELARGEVLYRMHCASCHGKQGRGDGPVAEDLRVRPADLTGLAKRAGGTFPAQDVAATIDGRTIVRGHGSREMPVWGLTFADRGRDTSQEREVAAEIRAVVRYLREMQGS